MKSWVRQPLLALCLVVAWRLLLLIFTAQPIPENDAFGYDGGVVNLLHGGGYCNPSMAVVFPISGREIYATYPPLYQAALLAWMKCFGTSVLAAMSLHAVLFTLSGFLVLLVLQRFFPANGRYALAMFLLFAFTFDDRPEGLAFVFGLVSLALAARQISENRWRPAIAAGLLLTLLLALYTSVIVGAYFFGAGFLACAAALVWRRNYYWFTPYIAAAVLFAAITFSIAKFEPRWWAGFMESARQQSVMTLGFRLPAAGALLKMVRTVPVFVLALAFLPAVWTRRGQILAQESPWLALSAGIFAMGWVLIGASLTLLSANYFAYAVYTQVLLAAGLLALAAKYFPGRERFLRASLLACVLLVSIRALGMSTWGVACASQNSYHDTQAVLRSELAPFVESDQPVLVSSAYLYTAAGMGVKNPIHSDWYFDHIEWTTNLNAPVEALIRILHPAKIVLTQFDYYRGYLMPLQQLEKQPALVAVRVRDFAKVPVPDAKPSLQRILQHISWAPVVVDLEWKPAN